MPKKRDDRVRKIVRMEVLLPVALTLGVSRPIDADPDEPWEIDAVHRADASPSPREVSENMSEDDSNELDKRAAAAPEER